MSRAYYIQIHIYTVWFCYRFTSTQISENVKRGELGKIIEKLETAQLDVYRE